MKKKRINLGKLPNVLPAQWLNIGRALVLRIRKDAEKGISQDDSNPTFAEYTKSYRKFKKKGLPHKGIATNTQISPPNLKYTNRMLRRIQADKPQKNGVTIVFSDGEKVLKNRSMKNRDIFDVNSKNMDWITKEILKIWEKNLAKIPNKTTHTIKM